jgi:hypothetical protein
MRDIDYWRIKVGICADKHIHANEPTPRKMEI